MVDKNTATIRCREWFRRILLRSNGGEVAIAPANVFTNTVPWARMYAYIQEGIMATTKIFKNGNSQAVRIPSELAYAAWDLDLHIERHGDELRIRPVQRRMGDVLGTLAKFSPDFMAEGRGENSEGEREAL